MLSNKFSQATLPKVIDMISWFLSDEMQHKFTKSSEKEAEIREMYLTQQSRLTELMEQLNSVTQEKKQLLSDLCHEKSLKKTVEDTQAK